MKKINILFLGGSKRVSLAEKLIEAGELLNYEVNIFSYELNKEVPIYFVSTEVIIGKMWNDPSLFKHLEEIIEQKDIHIIIPFLDQATVVASTLKEKRTDIFVASSNLFWSKLFFDKIKVNEWCISNDVSVPPNNAEEYPLIAKPRSGSASKGLVIIENRDQLLNISTEENLVQKFITGKEYTVDCFISQKGEILSITPRERIDVQGGESIKSLTIKSTSLINFTKEILIKTQLVGPITVQLIVDQKTGEIFFMELNPRFGGGVVTSIGAGANIPKYLLNDYLGKQQEYDDSWKDKTLMIRRFNEYFIQCK